MRFPGWAAPACSSCLPRRPSPVRWPTPEVSVPGSSRTLITQCVKCCVSLWRVRLHPGFSIVPLRFSPVVGHPSSRFSKFFVTFQLANIRCSITFRCATQRFHVSVCRPALIRTRAALNCWSFPRISQSSFHCRYAQVNAFTCRGWSASGCREHLSPRL